MGSNEYNGSILAFESQDRSSGHVCGSCSRPPSSREDLITDHDQTIPKEYAKEAKERGRSAETNHRCEDEG